jgi:hypothetical protein
MSETDVEKELRALGYDPEQIGKRGEVLVKTLFENQDLKEENAALREQVKELEEKLAEAVTLGHSQAKEWDRFWVAMGTADVTVDQAIEKYRTLRELCGEMVLWLNDLKESYPCAEDDQDGHVIQCQELTIILRRAREALK